MNDDDEQQATIPLSSFPPNRRKRKIDMKPDVENSQIDDASLEGNVTRIPKVRKKTSVPKGEVEEYFPKEKHGHFRVKGTSLYTAETKGNDGSESQKLLGRIVYIKEILHRIDVDPIEIYLKLRYWYHSQWEEIMIRRDQLQVYELSKLMISGVDVASYKVKQVAMFLDYQESDAPKRYEHTTLGWTVEGKKNIYKHNQMVGDSVYNSRFEGDFILSNGTFQGWQDVVKQEVMGHVPLEFALVAGFSAPIVSWIARDFDMEVLVLHAYGDSSKGKTTAARLFVSPFGRPARKDGGLILNWKATQNNMIGRIANTHGIPLALDEASMNKMSDFTEIIYLLAEGKEKGRMTKEIRLRKERTWSGTFFSTAEHSLLMKSNQNTGLFVRLQEFDNADWTIDGPHASRLKEGLLEHYGHAGPLFVEYLIKLGKPKVFELATEWSKRVHDKMPSQDGKSQRMSEKYGMLMATAELMNKCFVFQVDLDKLLEFLLAQYQTVATLGEYDERAYEVLKQLIMQHHTKFARDNDLPVANETWGKIFKKVNGIEVAFIKQVFRDQLIARGFENPDQILSKWKAKNLLLTEEGKKTKKRTIAGISSRDMYVVKFKENMLEPIEMETIKYREKQKKILDKNTGIQLVTEISYMPINEDLESIDDM
ncbi:DUF927 domain-containing protein [Paenisporosarcina macmurdoensis]|uniref:DUF927 domain-containing protein n=1 Tax=Paenisporosarcina macmurdoensis TaxID=212659 RepID=A0ABW1LAH1_9BACL